MGGEDLKKVLGRQNDRLESLGSGYRREAATKNHLQSERRTQARLTALGKKKSQSRPGKGKASVGFRASYGNQVATYRKRTSQKKETEEGRGMGS